MRYTGDVRLSVSFHILLFVILVRFATNCTGPLAIDILDHTLKLLIEIMKADIFQVYKVFFFWFWLVYGWCMVLAGWLVTTWFLWRIKYFLVSW